MNYFTQKSFCSGEGSSEVGSEGTAGEKLFLKMGLLQHVLGPIRSSCV